MIAEKTPCQPGRMCLSCPYPDCISGSVSNKAWFTTREETAMVACGAVSRKKDKASEFGHIAWIHTECWKDMPWR